MPAPRTIGLRTGDVTYPGGTEHIRAVRADLRAVFDDWPRADDVILCASELAANAAQHSRSRLPGGTFTVRATISPDHYARIQITTRGSRSETTAAPGTREWSIRPGTTGWTSFAPSPTNGGSTATRPAAPSGRDSTALSSGSGRNPLPDDPKANMSML
jgi:hypothetical protein